MWRLQIGEDPFTQLKQEKRERVKAQHQRQVANLKTSSKGGGDAVTLPPTLKLAAALPAHGRGKLSKRQEMQDDVRALAPAFPNKDPALRLTSNHCWLVASLSISFGMLHLTLATQ